MPLGGNIGMAAEALEKAGKKLGIPIKVETNGPGGAKNILTKKEIEACDGIIIAAEPCRAQAVRERKRRRKSRDPRSGKTREPRERLRYRQGRGACRADTRPARAARSLPQRRYQGARIAFIDSLRRQSLPPHSVYNAEIQL